MSDIALTKLEHMNYDEPNETVEQKWYITETIRHYNHGKLVSQKSTARVTSKYRHNVVRIWENQANDFVEKGSIEQGMTISYSTNVLRG